MKRMLPEGGRKAWLREEWRAIEHAASRAGAIPHAIVLWTYETASRITETLHAQWTDLDFHEQTITIDRLKGSDAELALPFSDELKAAISRLGRSSESPLLFHGITRCVDLAPKERTYEIAADKCSHGHLSQRYAFECFRRACREVHGLHPGLHHPHAAKHTRLYDMAEDLSSSGMAPHEIFDWLRRLSGHKSYDNLHIYLRSRQQGAAVMAQLREGLRRNRGSMPDVSTASRGGRHEDNAGTRSKSVPVGAASVGIQDPLDRRSNQGDHGPQTRRRTVAR